jgi:GxxExxY protein
MTEREYLDMYEFVGAAMEVYNNLGRGMAEPIYQEALERELRRRGMQYEREKELRLYYKDELMDKTYFVDFYYKGIMIELKSVEELDSTHRAQLFNYMRIAKKNRGILFNYGEESLHTERYLYLPNIDNFILLNQDNFRNYTTR